MKKGLKKSFNNILNQEVSNKFLFLILLFILGGICLVCAVTTITDTIINSPELNISGNLSVGGNLGIGTTTPTNPLYVTSSPSVSDAGTYPVIYSYSNPNMSGSNAISFRGMNSIVADYSSDNPTSALLGTYSQAFYDNNGGTVNNIYGALLTGQILEGEADTSIKGAELRGEIGSYKGDSSTPLLIGGHMYIEMTGVLTNVINVTDVIAGYFSGRLTADAGGVVDIENYYGAKIDDLTIYAGTPSVNNQYGLYIEEPTLGTSNNYSIYVVGGDSYFGGNVGINATTPQNTLNVIGDINATTGFVMGGNTGLTGNYSVGICYMAYAGGIMYSTNCTGF